MSKSIKWPFLLVLFLASAILVVSAYLYYQSETNDIRIEENKTLSTINHLKLDQLNQWRKERTGQAKFLPTVGQFIRYTDWLTKNPNNKEAQNYFIKILQPLKANKNFENVFICNKDGELLFSFDQINNKIDPMILENIKSSAEGDSLVIGNIRYDSNKKHICLDISVPIKENDGTIIGTFTQIVYPSNYLYPIIQNWPIDTRSGETLLAKKLKDRVIFLSELRFKDNSMLNQYVLLSDTMVVAVKGTMGKRGVIEGNDYRGKNVLAELIQVPGTDWLLISKIDKDEIYSEIFYRARTTIIILIVSMLTLVFITLYFYKSRQSNTYKELLSKEEEFKATLYSIGDGVITTDARGNIKQMNTVAEKLSGWNEKEARGKPLSKVFVIINEQTRKPVDNPVERVIKTGALISLANHTLLISKNGKEIPIADSGAPIKDNEGKIIGVVLVFRNQTEEREKEKALFESNEKYSKIFHHSSDSISLTQLSTGKLYEINEGFEKAFGYNRSEAIGKTTFELGLWANPDDRNRMIKQLKENGYVKDFEAVGYKRNGEKITAIISGEILEFKDDQYLLLSLRDITERKKIEKILIENEERLRLSLHAASQGMYDIKIQTDEVVVNDEYALMLGYDPKTFVEKSTNWNERIHPDDYEKWEKAYRDYIAGKTDKYKIEFRLKSKDNQWKWIMSLGKIVEYDNEGKPVRMLGTHTDITTKKLIEEELGKSEQLFRTLAEHSPVGIFRTDQAGSTTYVNKYWCELSNLSFEEAMGDGWFKVVHPDDKKMLAENWEKATSHNTDSRAEYRFLLPDGRIKWVIGNAVPLRNADGIITGYLGTITDITERKEAEATLRKLSQAVEQSNVSIVITNKDGIIEYVNPKFSEVSGYGIEEILGKNPKLSKSGYHTVEFYKDLWDTILSGKNWQGEIQNKKKNGELYWEFDIISPIFDETGNITHFVAVKEDVTEKKKMFEELITAKENAEEMNKAKSSFFANMSHELRTPFVGILGFAELLEETLTDPEEKDFAAKIVQSSLRLTDTLNKILNISRLESAFYELNLTPVNINELITDISGLFVQYAKTNNTVIKVETEFIDREIKTDIKLLEEILNNLLNNAVRFTKNGEIKIRSEKINSFLRLTVSDTGIGIPEDKQAIIWQEFRQASEGFNRSFEGTGLGLTLTRKYVILLGGTINMESEENKGTIFTIEIPVVFVEEAESKPGNNLKVETKTSDHKYSQKHKILFVDDDLVSCEYVNKVLGNIYKIDFINNGDEALSIVKKNNYDILLLDINLGKGIDGVELMQAIRKLKKYSNTPLVAVTAFAAESDKIEFLSKGFTHYISKPFTSSELKNLISGLLSKPN